MHPVTLNNAQITARLVGHAVYLKRKGLLNISLTDTAPKSPYVMVDQKGNITEVK